MHQYNLKTLSVGFGLSLQDVVVDLKSDRQFVVLFAKLKPAA
jgi:hypothetical protein